MSHLANALDQLLKESGFSAAELARRSGINEAQISRFRAGLQIWISSDDLIQLATGLASKDPARTHAQLLYAHLHDECVGPGKRFINVKLHPKLSPTVSNPITSEPLPPRIQENLDIIGQHIAGDGIVRDFIENIANLCRRQIASQQATSE